MEMGSITCATVDDKLYVAVGKDVKENKSTIIWALQNSGGKKIWILHVHTPAQMIPVLGGKFHVCQVGKQEVTTHHAMEKNEMLKALEDYVQLCAKAGVNAEKLYIEAESIENGIIKLISQHRIGRLVMGAAADNKYRKNMTEIKSRKAMNIRLQAPGFCQIWFVCKGYLIYTRARDKPTNPTEESGETSSLRSLSLDELPIDNSERNKEEINKWLTPRMTYGSFAGIERLSRISTFESADPSASSEVIRGSALYRSSTIQTGKNRIELEASPLEEKHVISSSSCLPERVMNDAVYEQLYKLMAEGDKEADNLSKEAYLESIKRRKAEKECIDAICKAQANENLYYEEQKRRKELEEQIAKEKEEREAIKNEHNKILEEFRAFLHHKSSLERELEKANVKVEELEGKLATAFGLIERYKREWGELEDEQLGVEHAFSDPTIMHASRFFADFTYMEIAEATDGFNPSRRIGEGGFGYTYKGFLRYTDVAIKVLKLESSQGPREFRQEVDVLSKLRHPNIVTLIGVCSEASALVYEYLPNGSLDDRLACKDNTKPLSWQTRIQIAAELCSVLIFLHSCKPESIVHGDLKPANVLLDAHLSCKLSDFGICRSISNQEGSMENTTGFCRTDPKGTFTYMDPEFVSTGELTKKSDVYSFGILLLRLLTGKSALGITREVQYAVDNDNLNLVLDPSAGDWPFVKAKRLALLALRCCDLRRKNRPDLVADIWSVLEPMKGSKGAFGNKKGQYGTAQSVLCVGGGGSTRFGQNLIHFKLAVPVHIYTKCLFYCARVSLCCPMLRTKRTLMQDPNTASE